MEKKKQHIIPQCYQKPWCDPDTPHGQEPFIWKISKDGSQQIRKSPKKAFVESDVYTIRLPSGGRELVIEKTLEQIENDFAKLLQHRITKRYSLDDQDRAKLCAFAAAMFGRVEPTRLQFTNFLRQTQEGMRHMEEVHGVPPVASGEFGKLLENADPQFTYFSIEQLTPLYFDMRMAIFVAPSTDPFITSDSPTVWYNPKWYTKPPIYRNPGLVQQDIEVTLPLSPWHMLFLSHNDTLTGYRHIPVTAVHDLNRRTRFHCKDWFISRHKEINEVWLDPGRPPEDIWENTPEGKRAVQESQESERLQQRLLEELFDKIQGEAGAPDE